MIVVDTGPLYAATDENDAHHHAARRAFEEATDRLVVPISVVVETSFLIERHLGPEAEAAFLRALRPSPIEIDTLTEVDMDRMAELVSTYADLPLNRRCLRCRARRTARCDHGSHHRPPTLQGRPAKAGRRVHADHLSRPTP